MMITHKLDNHVKLNQEDKMTKKFRKQEKQRVGKQVSREDRINDIKNLIRNNGLTRIPSNLELSKKYSVTRKQVYEDMKIIITQLDPRELDEVFTDFYQTDLNALSIVRQIMTSGNNADKIKAVNALITLQKGATELLEAFSKKSKVADKVEVKQVSYKFTMNKPAEPVFEVVAEKEDK